jgi:hypothetical protein
MVDTTRRRESLGSYHTSISDRHSVEFFDQIRPASRDEQVETEQHRFQQRKELPIVPTVMHDQKLCAFLMMSPSSRRRQSRVLVVYTGRREDTFRIFKGSFQLCSSWRSLLKGTILSILLFQRVPSCNRLSARLRAWTCLAGIPSLALRLTQSPCTETESSGIISKQSQQRLD